jgi:hypothetical protein
VGHRASRAVAFLSIAAATACGVLTAKENDATVGANPVLPPDAPTVDADAAEDAGSTPSDAEAGVDGGTCPTSCVGDLLTGNPFTDLTTWQQDGVLTLDTATYLSPPSSLVVDVVAHNRGVAVKKITPLPPRICIEFCAMIEQLGSFGPAGTSEVDLLETHLTTDGATGAAVLLRAAASDYAIWTAGTQHYTTFLTRGQWVHVEADIDYAQSKISISIDGKKVADNETTPPWSGESVSINIGASAVGALPSMLRMHFDDVVVRQPP